MFPLVHSSSRVSVFFSFCLGVIGLYSTYNKIQENQTNPAKARESLIIGKSNHATLKSINV